MSQHNVSATVFNNQTPSADSIITHVPPPGHAGKDTSTYQTQPNIISKHSMSKSPTPPISPCNVQCKHLCTKFTKRSTSESKTTNR